MVYCRCEAPRILISFNLIAASGFRVGAVKGGEAAEPCEAPPAILISFLGGAQLN